MIENHRFGALADLRSRPLPDLARSRTLREGYRTHPVDTGSAHYREALADIATLGIDGVNHYGSADNPPYHEVFAGSTDRLRLRSSVAARLQAADARLRAQGLKLYVHDAYRPTAVQAYAHGVWMPRQLRDRDPTLDGEALTAAVEQYWARPTHDPASPAPHNTGGAVDLSLAYAGTGQLLFMGTIFDDVTALAHTDAFEARAGSPSYSDREAVANRRLLYWVMTEAGFTNYAGEWWHYSWGDQMWARLTGTAMAVYGPAEA